MLKFLSLSSGSAGNCYYLSTGDKAILIDAGVSIRAMKKVFEANNIPMESFEAVLVTHDHMDHVRNLGSYCKRLNRAVYATEELLSSRVLSSDHVKNCAHPLVAEQWNDVSGFMVKYFVVPHDATQTVGYYIKVDGHSFVIMTDIGRMTPEALQYASEADTVVIESNYDMDMLVAGPYTHDLKMRICKGNGHLSNDECADAIKKIWHPGLKNLFLCHLSENNNTPEKAYNSALAALESIGVAKGTVNLRALPRRTPSTLIML